MAQYTIRPYEGADRPGLIGLARELQASENAIFDRMLPASAIGDAYLDALLKACRDHDGRMLVAEDDQGEPSSPLIGYVVVLTAMTTEDEPDERPYTFALVKDLSVTESRRGQGIGTALLAAAEDIARRAGVRWLRITALADNDGALRAYGRSGFQPLFVTSEKTL